MAGVISLFLALHEFDLIDNENEEGKELLGYACCFSVFSVVHNKGVRCL